MKGERTYHLKLLLIALCLLASIERPAFSQRKVAPLPLAEAVRNFDIGNRPRLSPDGRWIAYTLCDSSKVGLYAGQVFTAAGVHFPNIGCNVWIADTKTGLGRNLTGTSSTSWLPVWSPDNRSLAFFSDKNGKAQLWIWNRESDQVRLACDAVIRQAGDLAEFRTWDYLQWTPDSKKILTKLLPEGMTLKEAEDYIASPSMQPDKPLVPGSTATVYRSGTNAKTIAKSGDAPLQNVRQRILFGDLGLIDIATGSVQRIARRVQVSRYDVSPDGRYVAYLNAKGGIGSQSKYIFDLVKVSISDGLSNVLATDLSQFILGKSLKWSPDSKQLAYIDESERGRHWFLVSLDGERRQVIDINGAAYGKDWAFPIWDPSGQAIYFAGDASLRRVSALGSTPVEVTRFTNKSIVRMLAPPSKAGEFWSPDGGKSVYVQTLDHETKQEELFKIDLTTGQQTELLSDASRSGHSLAMLEASLTDHAVVYEYEDAQTSPDLWIATSDQKRARRITHANPVFDGYVLGQPRLIEWKNTDGLSRQGALLLPAGYTSGKRYPLIIWVYGVVNLSDRINRFGFGLNMHLLTTRGYAILLPDSSVDVGTNMADIAKNVMPGINKVVEMGIADASSLGVLGHSYGGYSALSLIVQTARFKAAICASGFYQLFSYYGSMDKNGVSESAVNTERRMGGSPWQFRDRYIENSPLFYLDRVKTPVLLLHGTLDSVPASQAEEVFVGLRRLGKEVEYVKYAGEGHSITYYPNQVDYWKRVIGWYDNRLRLSQQTEAAR